jgi:hypothetical protein
MNCKTINLSRSYFLGTYSSLGCPFSGNKEAYQKHITECFYDKLKPLLVRSCGGKVNFYKKMITDQQAEITQLRAEVDELKKWKSDRELEQPQSMMVVPSMSSQSVPIYIEVGNYHEYVGPNSHKWG